MMLSYMFRNMFCEIVLSVLDFNRQTFLIYFFISVQSGIGTLQHQRAFGHYLSGTFVENES